MSEVIISLNASALTPIGAVSMTIDALVLVAVAAGWRMAHRRAR